MAARPSRLFRVIVLLLLGGACVVAVSRFTNRPTAETVAALQQQSDANMAYLCLAVQAYVEQNGGRFPDTIEQALGREAVRGELAFEALQNPITGQSPGYLYRRPPTDDIDLTGWTAILYEMADGRVDPDGAIGYINGQVRRP